MGASGVKGTVASAGGGAVASADAASPFKSKAELREVLDALLSSLDTDTARADRIRAAGVAIRIAYTDLGLVLNVSPAEGEHSIRWAFTDDVEWTPRLRMEMSSEVANRYMQGRENLMIAMAKGRIRCSAPARAVLAFMPVSSAMNEHYREIAARTRPGLLLD